MYKTINFILISVVLVASSTLAESILENRPKLDCSGVQQFTFKTYLRDSKSACHQIIQIAGGDIDIRNTERFDLIHGCTCNVVSKATVWQSMMTYELKTLYDVIKNYVKDTVSEATGPLSRTFPRNEWDEANTLDALNTIYQIDNSRASLYTVFNERFLRKYNAFIASEAAINGKDMLKEHCDALKKGFAEFKAILEQVGLVAKNKRFINEVSTFDINLHKVLVVERACEIMMSLSNIKGNFFNSSRN